MLPVAFALLANASAAAAYDPYPCSKEFAVEWSPEPVQACPLTSPTGPNEGIPVYREPIPNPPGAPPPPPMGWIYGTEGKDFSCDQLFPSAEFFHPTAGWRNNWWARTRSAEHLWGWVPEVYFKGGANDEPDGALRTCPPPAIPPPPPPLPPPPSPPAPCSRTPISQAAKVEVSFANHRRVITVPFRRRSLVKGRIVSTGGVPLGGAGLCVGVQRAGKGRVKAVSSVSANDHGRFRLRLGRGLSRRVWFVHRVEPGAAVGSLMVRVRAPIALGTSRTKLRNGQAVKLSGRLRVAPRGGLLVEMQALRGRQWQTFATTKTKRSGRFSYRYRFTRTYGFQSYELRARIEKQPGSPFATGASKPVTVRVRG